MRLSIEPTTKMQRIDGAPYRIWRGTDQNGTEVLVHVRCVSPQTHDPARLEEFDRELQLLPPAAEECRPISLRFFVD